MRHCGCPFAEAEVKECLKIAKEQEGKGAEGITIVIVTMAEENITDDWFNKITGTSPPSSLILLSDPTRELYASFGISTLPFTGLFSRPAIVNLKKLASKGIFNTETRAGSNRWQNSGGFAIAKGGEIKWVHEAKHAGDMGDYEEAKNSVVSKIAGR